MFNNKANKMLCGMVRLDSVLKRKALTDREQVLILTNLSKREVLIDSRCCKYNVCRDTTIRFKPREARLNIS